MIFDMGIMISTAIALYTIERSEMLQPTGDSQELLCMRCGHYTVEPKGMFIHSATCGLSSDLQAHDGLLSQQQHDQQEGISISNQIVLFPSHHILQGRCRDVDG